MSSATVTSTARPGRRSRHPLNSPTYYSGGYDGCRTTGVPYYPVNRKFESFGSNVDQHNHYLTGTSFTAYWEDQWTNGSYRKVGNHEI